MDGGAGRSSLLASKRSVADQVGKFLEVNIGCPSSNSEPESGVQEALKRS